MKQLSWLKTKVGLFQDPRIMYLLSQPNGDTYVVLWFFLKDLAGSLNDKWLAVLYRDRIFQGYSRFYQLLK